MKRRSKRFLSLFLAAPMTLSMVVQPVYGLPAENPSAETSVVKEEATNATVETGEANTETEATEATSGQTSAPKKTVIVREDYNTYTINANDIDVSGIDGTPSVPEEGAELDESDPVINTVEEELSNMTVLNEDGESIPLTEEQIQTVLYLFQQYQSQQKEHADVLGIQNPFFLSYNDSEDGLGVLGEMLVLAEVSVEDVRSGNYSYEELVGMIQSFTYGDKFGVEYYSNVIKEKRDAALKAVKDSGAKTDAQKLLVLNDWLAQENSFDMAYIMNMDKEDPVMVAAEPQQNEHYQEMYDTVYADAEEQITKQFHDQFYNGIVAQLRQQYYENAIWNIIYQNAYDQYVAQKGETEETPEEGGTEETPEEGGTEETPEEGGAEETPEEGEDQEPAPTAEEGETEEKDPEADEYAKGVADQFMEDNADAIAEDAPGFVEENFGPEAAAQLEAGADAFIEQAETEGIEVDPENAPGYKMTIEQMTQQQMEETQLEDLGGMTANEAIPVYAKQMTEGIVGGILGYWNGNHIGVFSAEKSVCLGYAKAYAYLIQCMYPEYYGVNGADTDMTVAANWKEPKDIYYDEEGNLDPANAAYNVDLVRISFNTEVSMYGEAQPNFTSVHFWNAVKVNGTWYYVDPCYTDVYSETMSRDRVETDGFINHMYYLFSHSSTVEMYDGYYDEIATLYGDLATDKTYEDAWVARVKSNVYSDGNYFYYAYDSSDLITMLEDSNNDNFDTDEAENIDYKIVRHEITDTDKADIGETDYQALVELNYKENEDDETSVSRVYNPETGELEENELVTKLYAQHEEERGNYPSLNITAVYYNNKVYFNLSNCILSYDVESGAVAVVKEYNTVYAERDTTVAYGGMAFNLTDDESVVNKVVEITDADGNTHQDKFGFKLENHPLTGISLKDDGTLYINIATNLSLIAGKDPHNCEDQSSYGYQFEESNYNESYNRYFSDNGDFSDEQMEQMGYEKEVNDNDEFMWVANVLDTQSMSHLAGDSHSYEAVTVEPYCGRNGYTENRCTTCGAVEEGSRVETEDTALAHHYIHFDEEFYTKDNGGNWNADDCYVCTVCGFSISEPKEPSENSGSMGGDSYEERMAEYEKKKAIWDEAVETAGHTYVPTDAQWSEDSTSVTFSALECDSVCPERKDTLDCLLGDDTIAVTLNEAATAEAAVTGHEGECTTGTTVVYTASGEAEGYKYNATNKVKQEPGKHSYEGEFTWTEVTDNEGNGTGEYEATATLTCAVCGDVQENVKATVTKDEENSVAPACETEGKDVFTATAVAKNEDGEEIGSATGTKEVVLPANGHHYVDGICDVCGAEEPLLDAPVIESVYSKKQDTAKVTWTKLEKAEGYQIWRAASPDASEADWSLIKTIKGDDVEKYTKDGTMQYTNVNLTVGQTYYYKVRAFKVKSGATDANDEASRNYSEFSEVKYMPAAVVFDNLYSNSTSRVRILWNEISGAHGYQIWRKGEDGEYKIVKTLGDKGNTLTDDQGATTAYSNTGLEAGKTYTYKMRAFAIPEEGTKVFGTYSDEFTVAVMPEAPKLSGSSNKAGRATLTWNKVTGAAGYQVWMSTSKDGAYSIVKSITNDLTTSYTKNDLQSETTYFFKLRAYTEVDGKKTFSAYTDSVMVTVK